MNQKHKSLTVHTSLGPLPYRIVGDGPAVIIAVHGLLVDGRLWDAVANDLADQATIIIPDFPFGAHHTPVPNRELLNPPGVADAIIEILDELQIPQAMLLGNDLGTALGQMLAVAEPERITSLALTNGDIFDSFPPKMFKPLFAMSHLPGVTKAFVSAFSLKPMFAKPSPFNNLVRHPVDPELVSQWVGPAKKDREIRRDLIACMRTMSPSYTNAAAQKLGSYEGKALLAWAREDKLFRPADAERLAKIIPNSEIVWIDDAYAYSPLDQPLAIASAIKGMLPPVNG